MFGMFLCDSTVGNVEISPDRFANCHIYSASSLGFLGGHPAEFCMLDGLMLRAVHEPVDSLTNCSTHDANHS